LDEIGGAIEDVAKANSYGLVRDYGGHGIGLIITKIPLYSTIALVAGRN